MGSSSSGGRATREAQEAEDERRRQIEASQKRIESIFASPQREGQIQDFVGSTRDFLQGDLDRQKGINDRELKFALARGGLSGGSTDIDQNQLLSEAFLRASVDADRRALGAGDRLRDADQQSKISLFNQALGGLDATTAAQNASQAMRTNIGLARTEGSEGNFDNFFSKFSRLFEDSRKAKATRDEQKGFFQTYGRAPDYSTPVAGGYDGGY